MPEEKYLNDLLSNHCRLSNEGLKESTILFYINFVTLKCKKFKQIVWIWHPRLFLPSIASDRIPVTTYLQYVLY